MRLLTLLTFGPTRVGKSSLINTISNQSLAKIGDAKGHSTTSDVARYEFSLPGDSRSSIAILDVPGTGDSRLQITDEEIRKKIEFCLFEMEMNPVGLNAILLFESCFSESIELVKSLQNLQSLLGNEVNKSIVVVITKHNLASGLMQQAIEPRLNELELICRNLGLSFIYWESSFRVGEFIYEVPSAKLHAQTKELIQKVNILKPFTIDSIVKLYEQIKILAEKLLAEYEPGSETQSITLDVNKIEPTIIEVTKQRPVIDERWAGNLGKWFGVKNQILEWKDYKENETHYKIVKDQDTREITLQKPKPDIAYFNKIAKDQLLREHTSALKRSLNL